MSPLAKRRPTLPRTMGGGHAPSQKQSAAQNDVRALLLDAGERLFAERGIEAVSLREIAAEAGQKNNSAVSYHFRDKRGLLDALIADRILKVERVRHRLIEALDVAVNVLVEQRQEKAKVLRVTFMRRCRHQKIVVRHLG